MLLPFINARRDGRWSAHRWWRIRALPLEIRGRQWNGSAEAQCMTRGSHVFLSLVRQTQVSRKNVGCERPLPNPGLSIPCNRALRIIVYRHTAYNGGLFNALLVLIGSEIHIPCAPIATLYRRQTVRPTRGHGIFRVCRQGCFGTSCLKTVWR